MLGSGSISLRMGSADQSSLRASMAAYKAARPFTSVTFGFAPRSSRNFAKVYCLFMIADH